MTGNKFRSGIKNTNAADIYKQFYSVSFLISDIVFGRRYLLAKILVAPFNVTVIVTAKYSTYMHSLEFYSYLFIYLFIYSLHL